MKNDLPKKRNEAWLWQAENSVFLSLGQFREQIKLASHILWPVYFPRLDPQAFHYIFIPLSSWGGGVMDLLWWAHGVQPGSTHCRFHKWRSEKTPHKCGINFFFLIDWIVNLFTTDEVLFHCSLKKTPKQQNIRKPKNLNWEIFIGFAKELLFFFF